MQHPSRSNFKVVISGPVVETYEFEREVSFGYKGYGGRDFRKRIPDLKHRKQTLFKARRTIYRLSFANFTRQDKFITLTFTENISDITFANKQFKQFIQKLRHRYGDFRYLAVYQFQDRDVIHYHILANLPYIPQTELHKLWAQGFVSIKGIQDVDNIGGYLSSHITIDPADTRLQGHRHFSSSRNLIRPTILRGPQAKELILSLQTKKEVSAVSYNSEYLGLVRYLEFNLNSIDCPVTNDSISLQVNSN